MFYQQRKIEFFLFQSGRIRIWVFSYFITSNIAACFTCCACSDLCFVPGLEGLGGGVDVGLVVHNGDKVEDDQRAHEVPMHA